MEMTVVRDLYLHMEWADARVWRAVLALPVEAPEDEALLRTMLHIHTVQRAFLSIWRGEEPTFRKRSDFASVDELALWAREGHALLQAHLASVSSDDSSRDMLLPWAARISQVLGREPAPSTFADTILQVPMHSTYHRGQANARIRALGGEPPLVDYIAWVWGGRGEPKWEV